MKNSFAKNRMFIAQLAVYPRGRFFGRPSCAVVLPFRRTFRVRPAARYRKFGIKCDKRGPPARKSSAPRVSHLYKCVFTLIAMKYSSSGIDHERLRSRRARAS